MRARLWHYPRMLRRLAPALAGLAVVMAYVRVLGAPFVWDDYRLILDAPSVVRLQPLMTYFGSPFWQSPETGELRGYYRPLTILSFALDHTLHGDNPAGFHLTNLLLHATSVVLLYLLMRRHGVRPNVAFVLVLLWGLLPRSTEAVAWVAGRTDVLATTCVLAALLVYRPHRIGSLVLASALVGLGMLAKEVALSGAVALVVLEVSTAAAPRRRAPLLVPIASVVACLALRHAVLAGASEDNLVVTHSAPWRAFLALAALGEYARMLVLPWFPELQIGSVSAPSRTLAAVGALLLAGGAVGWRYARPRTLPTGPVGRPLVLMGSALFVTGLGLVIHLVQIPVNVVAADRFLYLPSAGLALLVAPFAEEWRAPIALKVASAIALVTSFFAATVVRAGDWCSEIDLWTKAYRETPKDNGIPVTELGNVYYRAGLFVQAEAIYARAAADVSGLAETNHANAMSQLGEYDEAAKVLTELCLRWTHVGNSCLAAGLVELHRLHFAEARSLAQEAVDRTHGNYADASHALEAISHVELLVQSESFRAALVSKDPAVRDAACFELAERSGRRPEALALAASILRASDTPRALRLDAAEYFVRFGPPGDLSRVLRDPGALDVVDPPLLAAAHLRAQTAEELMERWAALGFDSGARVRR